MPKHIARLLLLVVVLATAALTAKHYFTDKSYYAYGHYRGDSVAEIASDEPRFRGNEYCKTCHAKQYDSWLESTHNQPVIGKHVKCEVCHGPVGQHPSAAQAPLSVDERIAMGSKAPVAAVATDGKLLLPKDRTKCIQCHEAMPGRPAAQRQVVLAAHAGTEQCTACHDPHSPKINFAILAKAPHGDAAAGKVLAATCAACHGAAGASVNPAWPNLAGQHAGYLVNALQAFKSGTRPNAMMSGMAAGLSDADINNVAAYFSQASCKTAGADPAKALLGKTKAASCALCHGANGVSPSTAWPSLAGQNPDYLSDTLKSFQDGTRNHPVMTSIAKTLSADDVAQLTAYYASTSCK